MRHALIRFIVRHTSPRLRGLVLSCRYDTARSPVRIFGTLP